VLAIKMTREFAAALSPYGSANKLRMMFSPKFWLRNRGRYRTSTLLGPQT